MKDITKKEKNKLNMRKLRAERRLLNKCQECGGNNDRIGYYCSKSLVKHNESETLRKYQWILNNRCPYCGCEIIEPQWGCNDCKDKAAKRWKSSL